MKNENTQITKAEQKIISPIVYFGNHAIKELQRRGILSIGKTTCQKPFKMSDDCDHPWVKFEYESRYHRVPKKGITCGSAIFYTLNESNDIFCISCKNIDNLDAVSIWYQTTKCNLKPYIDGWYNNRIRQT